MSNLIGSIEPFNENSEDFPTYQSRVELYFKANDIEEEKKASVFLTLVGAKIFTLTKNLLSPIEPASATYQQITDALTVHFKPKRIVIYERFKFYSRNQKSSENIKDFVAAIKALASTCEFSTTLKDMLRDRFVMGLSNANTQQYLLVESNLTFDKAVEVAIAREAASRDIQAAQNLGVTASSSNSINKVQNDRKSFAPKYANKTEPKQNKSNNAKPKNPCLGCGQYHWKRDCPFKDSECFNCKMTGHLKKMCKKSNNTNSSHKSNFVSENESHTSNNITDYDYVFKVSDTKVPPILIKAKLNSAELDMELDTGASRSIISEEVFCNTWADTRTRPKLSKCDLNLQAYGGVPLTILGEIQVKLEISGKEAFDKANIVVIRGRGPCLLGRDLMGCLDFPEYKIPFSNINKVSNCSFYLKKFPKLFSSELGSLKDREFSIEVDPTVPPKFCKARPVPYALRKKVDLELDRLIETGTITPIPHSSWAAPIVPVLKADNSIRICGDYKLTANKAARLDTYPIPKLEDLFSILAEGKMFTKLDMSQAYAQLSLDEKSKVYTVVNTHRGLFKYNRLCFGISSAPGIFQRAMEELLKDSEGVSCYLDDILICGSTKSEHDDRLTKVLEKLQASGLRLKWEKCQIGLTEVQYLGYKIDGEGIHPSKSKVQAIVDAPEPKDITQLRAYLGLLNFYRKFIPNASSLLEPLNRLLRKDVSWRWGVEQGRAFEESKKILLNSKALVHFDPNKPIVVVADSSSYGVGAVLCHLIDGIERPITFASRTLSPAERNYSQLEKEALAMVYALKQFHFYLWGQKFTLVTDHKPLLGLFGPNKSISPMASGRIQRWSLILQAYSFSLVHRSGALLGTADALSRLPSIASAESTPVPADWTNLINFLDWSPITGHNIQEYSRRDPVISKVLFYCREGWPTSTIGDPNLIPYVRRKEELSIQNGCLLWGSRVIVPPPLRPKLLEELHSSHSGISRMKELARGYFWWPKLDSELESLTQSCPECLELKSNPPRAELHPWEWPEHPWHRLHLDYAGPVKGQYFLIVVDAHSKWVEVIPTSGPTTKETIKALQHLFATFGLPISIVSDNGPCFSSEDFSQFMTNCGIRHTTTAVYKPSSNGLAERMVQTFKKALRSSSDPLQLTIDRFVYNYRLTPHTTTGVSPAELMFGRRIRSRLDLLRPKEQISARVASKQDIQKSNYTHRPRNVEFPIGSSIMYRNYTGRGARWIPGEICEKTGPVSYKCQTPEGNLVKRHQDQLITRGSDTVLDHEPQNHDPSLEMLSPSRIRAQSPVGSPIQPPEGMSHDSPTRIAATPPPTDLRRSARVRKPVAKLNL